MATPQIVSASFRTDIPAFYADWFGQRLAAGEVMVRNPYGGPDYRVSLAPDDVLGFVFWSRNLRPFLENLEEVGRRNIPFIAQMTVTGYPRVLETSTISVEAAIDQIKHVSNRFGQASVVWRYDPILMTSATTPDGHIKTFKKIASALRGSVDECVVSFATLYAKTKRRLESIRHAEEGFSWWDPANEEKREMLRTLQEIAVENEMALTVCAQPDLLMPGVEGASCVDARRLSKVAGYAIDVRQKGNREGCLCARSRDIGAYDTCPHGCAYCYAVRDGQKAKSAYAGHHPDARSL